jgi:putative transposase
MAGTYSQIYIHVVFAVKHRASLLEKPWRERVFRYMSGIVENRKQKSIIVNGVSDHVHILIGMKPSILLSDLIRDVKNNSTNFINDEKFIQQKFSWQEGFGAFSCGQSQLSDIYQYILGQEQHHGGKTFKDEYKGLLNDYNIDHDEKYLFDWIL